MSLKTDPKKDKTVLAKNPIIYILEGSNYVL